MNGHAESGIAEKDLRIWTQAVEILRRIGTLVPAYTDMDSLSEDCGLLTGSNGVSTFRYIRIPMILSGIQNHLIRNAPQTETGDLSPAFFARWASAVCRSYDLSDLYALYEECNFAANVPAIQHKTADADEQLRVEVMTRLRQNQPALIPVKAPEKIIRGDRAASVMNLMVPQIRENLKRVKDSAERAALESRLDALGQRVGSASADADEARVLSDIRLSIETLEESVEHRIQHVMRSPS